MAVPTFVFETDDSVVFVGGRGTKAGDANAGGGCTKDYWGDLKSPSKTLADVMGTNGEPISAAGAWNGCQICCDIAQAAESCHILVVKTGAFVDVEVGHIAHVKFHSTSVYVGGDGRFEVLARTDDNITILMNYISSEANKCDAKVGGAFDKLQTASDETDANTATPHDVEVLTNKAEVFTGAGDEIDIDVGGGDSTAGTWKRVVGIDDTGVELADGEYLAIDADGQATNVVEILNLDNISFHHIWTKNATSKGWRINNSSGHYGYLLDHCKSTGSPYGFQSESTNTKNLSIIGGHYEGTSTAIYLKAIFGSTIEGVYCYSPGSYVIYNSYYSSAIRGCVIESDGTGVGVWLSSQGLGLVVNNVFYNVTNGIHTNSANNTLVEYNNIFVVAAKATGKAINRNAGGVIYSDYSCMWALDGAPVAANRWGEQGIGPNSIEADPQFVDAANGDFRIELSSPCLRTGRSTLGQL